MSVTPYAILGDHNALLAALRRRQAELGITNELLERISGIQTGYASKALSNPPAKRLGPFLLFVIAEALGLRLAFVEDPALVERMRARWTKRHNRKPVPAQARNRIIQLTPDYRRRVARLGGYARAQRLGPDRCRESARHAARARWARRVAASGA